MTNQDIIQKLRRLHTLLVLGKRSNNLAMAIRRAIDNISSWRQNVDEMIAKTPIRQLFAGYGPKFIRIFTELCETGDIKMIQELQPEFDEFFCYLCEIPSIGETMARRMFFERSIRSMDDLRIAYTNNVLQRIPAFGDSRFKAIEYVLWNSQASESSDHLWQDLSEPSVPGFHDDQNRNDNPVQLELFPDHVSAIHNIHKSQKLSALPARSKSSDAFKTDHASATLEDKDEEALSDRVDVNPHAAYSQEFIQSNSTLFRNDPQDVSRNAEPVKDDDFEHDDSFEHDDDFEQADRYDNADDFEDDLNDILEPEKPAPFDAGLSRELEAFIAKDLKEHQAPSEHDMTRCDVSICGDDIQTQTLHVHILHADHIYADIVHASIIRVRQIQMRSESIHSDILSLPEHEVQTHDILNVSSVSAETIFADIIETNTLEAHILDAKIYG